MQRKGFAVLFAVHLSRRDYCRLDVCVTLISASGHTRRLAVEIHVITQDLIQAISTVLPLHAVIAWKILS